MHAIENVDVETLGYLQKTFQSHGTSEEILSKTDRRLASFASIDTQMMDPEDHGVPAKQIASIVNAVETILEPLHVDWMDEDNGPRHTTVQRALDDIANRFERSVPYL